MKTQSVVVMPVAHRPEFLALALECLMETKYTPFIHIYVDDVSEKLKEEFRYVFSNYMLRHSGELHFRDPHRPASSGVWNILHSIKDGYETGAQNVFLVEEDVFVRPEFFTRHWDTMRSGYWLASCGRICPRFSKSNLGVYTNPGSCLGRTLLDQLIPHINDRFFDDTGAYIREMQTENPGYIGGLDDGLIRRVITVMGGAAYHQMPPVCSHVGFQAFENRYDFCQINADGKIEERIADLRKMFLRIDPLTHPMAAHLRDFDPLTPGQIELFARGTRPTS